MNDTYTVNSWPGDASTWKWSQLQRTTDRMPCLETSLATTKR
jgi:hypothetical protein